MPTTVLIAYIVLGLLILLPSPSQRSRQETVPTGTPISTYSIVKVYPHDSQAFTQGLQFVDGVLYEGTGLNGRSDIRKVQLESGAVLERRALEPQYFGEGITVIGRQLIQLTYQSEIGFVYDRHTFERIKQFAYRGEGWGLTHDGRRLIMSDGTSELRFLNPGSLVEQGRLQVRDGRSAIDQLNELEVFQGDVLANIWRTNRIARISITSGKVLEWIDLSGLLSAREAEAADVLNGIAYDAVTDRLFVTGKLWPKLFEIKIVRRHPR